VTRCAAKKRGKFANLQCLLASGHEGPCNFVVLGVRPLEGAAAARRKLSDAQYAAGRVRAARRRAAR